METVENTTNSTTIDTSIKLITPFKSGLFTNYIFKSIPLVFDESLSYYETLLGLRDYLINTVIPTINENSEKMQTAVEELITEYNKLVENYNAFMERIEEEVAELETHVDTLQTNFDTLNNDWQEYKVAMDDIITTINTKLDNLVDIVVVEGKLTPYNFNVPLHDMIEPSITYEALTLSDEKIGDIAIDEDEKIEILGTTTEEYYEVNVADIFPFGNAYIIVSTFGTEKEGYLYIGVDNTGKVVQSAKIEKNGVTLINPSVETVKLYIKKLEDACVFTKGNQYNRFSNNSLIELNNFNLVSKVFKAKNITTEEVSYNEILTAGDTYTPQILKIEGYTADKAYYGFSNSVCVINEHNFVVYMYYEGSGGLTLYDDSKYNEYYITKISLASDNTKYLDYRSGENTTDGLLAFSSMYETNLLENFIPAYLDTLDNIKKKYNLAGSSDVDTLTEEIGKNTTEINSLDDRVTANEDGLTTLEETVNNKQDKLTAGDNITISEDNVISATGGGSEIPDEYKNIIENSLASMLPVILDNGQYTASNFYYLSTYVNSITNIKVNDSIFTKMDIVNNKVVFSEVTPRQVIIDDYSSMSTYDAVCYSRVYEIDLKTPKSGLFVLNAGWESSDWATSWSILISSGAFSEVIYNYIFVDKDDNVIKSWKLDNINEIPLYSAYNFYCENVYKIYFSPYLVSNGTLTDYTVRDVTENLNNAKYVIENFSTNDTFASYISNYINPVTVLHDTVNSSSSDVNITDCANKYYRVIYFRYNNNSDNYYNRYGAKYISSYSIFQKNVYNNYGNIYVDISQFNKNGRLVIQTKYIYKVIVYDDKDFTSYYKTIDFTDTLFDKYRLNNFIPLFGKTVDELSTDWGIPSSSVLETLETTVTTLNTQVTTNTTDITTLKTSKQDKLTAGDNITISEDNVISATGGSGDISALQTQVDTNTSNIATNTTNITTNITDITTLKTSKQDKLTAGDNITISDDNVISATGGSGDISALQTQVDTNTSDIDELKTDVATNTNNISNNTTNITTLETNVANKQDKLTAGHFIQISSDNVISSSAVVAAIDSKVLRLGDGILSTNLTNKIIPNYLAINVANTLIPNYLSSQAVDIEVEDNCYYTYDETTKSVGKVTNSLYQVYKYDLTKELFNSRGILYCNTYSTFNSDIISYLVFDEGDVTAYGKGSDNYTLDNLVEVMPTLDDTKIYVNVYKNIDELASSIYPLYIDNFLNCENTLNYVKSQLNSHKVLNVSKNTVCQLNASISYTSNPSLVIVSGYTENYSGVEVYNTFTSEESNSEITMITNYNEFRCYIPTRIVGSKILTNFTTPLYNSVYITKIEWTNDIYSSNQSLITIFDASDSTTYSNLQVNSATVSEIIKDYVPLTNTLS